jgi:hypothetical protein
MSNIAKIRLPRGYGFKVSASSNAGAHNFARLSLMRNGITTSLGLVEPGASQRMVRAVLADAEVVVEGLAGDWVPSLLHPRFQDPGLDQPAVAFYNDAYGTDRDYNDLIVTVTRFQAFPASFSGLNIEGNAVFLDPMDAMALHPKLAEAEKLIAKLDSGEPISAADYSDLPWLSSQLNPEEKKLFDKDPVAGARVFLAAKSAISATQTLYKPESLYNGNGDAFRHMYWSFQMTRSIGEAAAESWGIAHESEPGNPQLEKVMDLHNNSIGRKLAKTGVDDVPKDLRAAVRNGSCRIFIGTTLAKSDSTGEV